MNIDVYRMKRRTFRSQIFLAGRVELIEPALSTTSPKPVLGADSGGEARGKRTGDSRRVWRPALSGVRGLLVCDCIVL
jgi:hypothetical protein